MPPFDMSASCHAPLSGGLFWPATTTCASELAAQHFVDPTFTLQVHFELFVLYRDDYVNVSVLVLEFLYVLCGRIACCWFRQQNEL